MHLYFITRGIKYQRDIFVHFMQSQMFNWKRKNLKTGKEDICRVQGALRPIELWEYVFPEESLDEVLTMLDLNGKNPYGVKKSLWNKFKDKAAILRKILGAEPLPKNSKPVQTNKYVEHRGLAIHAIGIKKDERKKMPQWNYEQELL